MRSAAETIDQGLGQVLDGFVGKIGDAIDGGINVAGRGADHVISGGFRLFTRGSDTTLSGIVAGFLATQPGASPGQSASPTQPADSLGFAPIGKETSPYHCDLNDVVCPPVPNFASGPRELF